MTGRRAPLERLPYWPRMLSREEAARYVGVSPNLFDAEVEAGKWPGGLPRGAKGGRLTWDRVELDLRMDARLGSASPVPIDDFEARRNAAKISAGRQPGPSAPR